MANRILVNLVWFFKISETTFVQAVILPSSVLKPMSLWFSDSDNQYKCLQPNHLLTFASFIREKKLSLFRWTTFTVETRPRHFPSLSSPVFPCRGSSPGDSTSEGSTCLRAGDCLRAPVYCTNNRNRFYFYSSCLLKLKFGALKLPKQTLVFAFRFACNKPTCCDKLGK